MIHWKSLLPHLVFLLQLFGNLGVLNVRYLWNLMVMFLHGRERHASWGCLIAPLGTYVSLIYYRGIWLSRRLGWHKVLLSHCTAWLAGLFKTKPIYLSGGIERCLLSFGVTCRAPFTSLQCIPSDCCLIWSHQVTGSLSLCLLIHVTLHIEEDNTVKCINMRVVQNLSWMHIAA